MHGNCSLVSSSDDDESSEGVLFDISDYLTLCEEEKQPILNDNNIGSAHEKSSDYMSICNRSKNMAKKGPRNNELKIAFRTKSELEILEDGYKWRKYGKKMMKNSINPRNYFRCSSQGCNVKKRVEREENDPQYVITTYQGVHNHNIPSLATYNKHSTPTFTSTSSFR